MRVLVAGCTHVLLVLTYQWKAMAAQFQTNVKQKKKLNKLKLNPKRPYIY
ncbi:exported hypothetical protein [Vibrio chagasii]|nr:exported hypothetical protein [Vibrio chagasii]CAH7215449.1 exported hypothetical protein [Vibrio chagasii]CAH7312455.1 exported hypothetical protein [Vibrio chagasii]